MSGLELSLYPFDPTHPWSKTWDCDWISAFYSSRRRVGLSGCLKAPAPGGEVKLWEYFRLAFPEVNPPGLGMNAKRGSLGYRRNLAAWVEMMRARQAAASELWRADESSALNSSDAEDSSALPRKEKQAGGGQPPRLGRGVAALARAWPGEDVVDGRTTVWQRRLQSVAAPGCPWSADESSAFPDFKADESSALHRHMSRFEPSMSHAESGPMNSSSTSAGQFWLGKGQKYKTSTKGIKRLISSRMDLVIF